MLLIVLPILTLLTLKKKEEKQGRLISSNFDISTFAYIISAIASFVIGLYDGFFGPGTGTFYTILFSFMGLPLIFSAGTTKVLNLTSNIAAFVTFIINGTIFFNVGLPCAIASIIGNILGSNYAIKKEGKAIKKLLVIVIALLYIKIVSELIF